jgi:Bacterial Ig-like domain (group 2)
VNKKLVLSVLSTAVVASMAASAMAKPEAGFYIGGNVDKYYDIDAFFNHFDQALDEILDNPVNTTFVDGNGNAAKFLDVIAARGDLSKVLEPARRDHFEDDAYQKVDGEGSWDPNTDTDLLPDVGGELKVESVSAITPTTLKVEFANAVAELSKANVTVKNVATGEKQYVKAVTLAEDGTFATVELYEALASGKTYNVTVTIGEDSSSKDFDFVVGDVATIEAAATQLVKSGNIVLSELDYKVLDAAGLDITSSTDVTFEASVNITSGAINLTNGQTAFVYVVAKKEDGTEVKSNRITVKAEDPKPAVISNYTVSNATPDFDDEDYQQSLVVQKGQSGYRLYVEAEDQFGDEYPANGAVKPTFESLDKTVALVDRNTGAITALKEGTVPVKITYGDVTQTVELTIVADAKATTLELSETEVSISNSVTTPTTVDVSVKDQYNNVFDFDSTATVTVLSGKDLVTVGNTLSFTNGEATLSIRPVANKSGTAVIEIKITDAIKATVTVNVTAAGAVDNYVVEGFKATLDKYDNPDTSVNESTAELDVFPVDANGVKTGDEVSATYTVKDAEGTTVISSTPTSTAIDATNSDLEVGETYTVTVKVGTITVYENTFTVVDSTPKPSVELTSGSLTDGDADLDLFDDLAAKLKVSGKGFEDASVAAVSFKSDNGSVVASADDVASIAILGEGNATLVLTSVTVDKDGDPSTDTDRVEVDFSEIISVSVDFEDLAQVLPEENVVAHTVADIDDNEVTGTYEDGVYTISHDFTKLTEEQGGAPSVAKWIGVYIEGPENATKVAKLTITGTNPKSFENVEFETETGYEDGFFYFFPANENGNENDLTIAWADDDGNIVKVEKLKVKYVNTASE